MDLGPIDGVTPNDFSNDIDFGANDELNYPLWVCADPTGVRGGPAPPGAIIELFINADQDPSLHGEGMTIVGSAIADSDGAFMIPVPLSPGQFVTATATDNFGNTSEFFSSIEVNPSGQCTEGVWQPAPEILLSSETLDFGNVIAGDSSYSTVLVISNFGDETLTGNVSDPPPPFSLTDGGGAFTVAPRNIELVEVQFAPSSNGNFTSSVTITSNDPQNSVLVVNLSGTAITCPPTETDCTNGVDDDCDGLVDCDDPDCNTDPAACTTTLCQCPADTFLGCISGRVANRAGQPLAGKIVKLKRKRPRRPRVKMTAVTDVDGCYSFENLDDGKYKGKGKGRPCRGRAGRQRVDISGGDKHNNVNLQCRR